MIPRDDWNPSRPDRGVDVAAGSVLTRAGEPGDEFFGEMSLLDGGPRSATVVADTSVRLLVISRRHFSALLRDVPGLTQTILVTLSKRVRQAEERAERLKSVSTGL
jgi:CRP-like cAMP-binding protein